MQLLIGGETWRGREQRGEGIPESFLLGSLVSEYYSLSLS